MFYYLGRIYEKIGSKITKTGSILRVMDPISTF